jgi:hypothetical protein
MPSRLLKTYLISGDPEVEPAYTPPGEGPHKPKGGGEFGPSVQNGATNKPIGSEAEPRTT